MGRFDALTQLDNTPQQEVPPLVAQKTAKPQNDKAASPHAQAAIQYLFWAVEEIEKTGNKEAARHARIALKGLQESIASPERSLSAARTLRPWRHIVWPHPASAGIDPTASPRPNRPIDLHW